MAFSTRLRTCILLLIIVIVLINIASSEAKRKKGGSTKPARPQPPKRPPAPRTPKPPRKPTRKSPNTPPIRRTTKSPTKHTTRPPTRPPTKHKTRPPTRPPTTPPIRRTTKPPTRPTTRPPTRPTTRPPTRPTTRPTTIAPIKTTTKTPFVRRNNSSSGTSGTRHETNINNDFLAGERGPTNQHNKNDLTKKTRPDIQEHVTKVNHEKLNKDPARDTHTGSSHVDKSKLGNFSQGKGNNSTRPSPMDKNQNHNVMKGNHMDSRNSTKENFNKHGFNNNHQSPKDVDQHHKNGKFNQTNIGNSAKDNFNKHGFNNNHQSPKDIDQHHKNGKFNQTNSGNSAKDNFNKHGLNNNHQSPKDTDQHHKNGKFNQTNSRNAAKDNFNKQGFNNTHQLPKDVDQHHKIGKFNQTNNWNSAKDNSNKNLFNITHPPPKVQHVKNPYGQFNISRIPPSKDRNSTHHRPSHGGEPLHQYVYVPGQTVVVMNPQTQSPHRGFSDMLQEALVRGITRGAVNAIFGTGNHSDHHSHGVSSGNSVRPSPSHTTVNNVNITTINYYINGTDNVKGNDGSISSHANMSQGTQYPPTNIQPNGNSTLAVEEFRYAVTDDELRNLTQSLFMKDDMITGQFVRMNLQTQSVGPNMTVQAREPLLYVNPDAYKLPTIQAFRKLFDNYEFDSVNKEFMDQQKLEEENAMLDIFLHTDIMYTTMRWLSNKGYIEPDEFAWKDALHHIWMSKVNGATSGFERIFLAEKYPGPSIIGGQNWIYFDYQESLKRIIYLNYVNQTKLDDRGSSLIKVNYKFDDVVKQDTTMLVGTPPELEMALYTICYYVRLNDPCLVWHGNTPFIVYAHAFRDHGKDRLDLGVLYS